MTHPVKAWDSSYLDATTFMKANVLSKQLHWLTINPQDQVIEMVLDHHMMSTFRMCPARFYLEMVQGWAPKGSFWFLEFGQLLHSCLEYYYQNFRNTPPKPEFTIPVWFDFAKKLWAEGDFDKYKEIPGYKNVGGCTGFLALLQEYYFRFSAENERLRIIGTELYFGKGKEVPLLSEPLSERIPFRLYLSGKIDILCDTYTHIAPMDHKSHGDFRGQNPNKAYEIQEGMTGYVYANRELVKKFDLEPGSRQTNMILMNHIQVKPGKVSFQDRFTRVPMRRNDWDLEQYRLRQVATARDIFNMLIDTMDGIPAQYNAGVCSNWWHNECQFHKVHRQTGEDAQFFVLQNEYIKKPIWDPENRDNDGSSAN